MISMHLHWLTMGLVPVYVLNVDLAGEWFNLRTVELPAYKI